MDALRAELVALSRRAHALGLVPATSGNFSARLDARRFLVSASGHDKGALGPDDFVVTTFDLEVEHAAPGRRPSAEAALHAALYRARPDVGAVAHTHSVAATVLSRRATGDALSLRGYELAKALDGVDTHDTDVRVPVLENSQDMGALAGAVARAAPRWALLLRGHGLYTVGADVAQLGRHLEAVEHLLACALHEQAT